MQSQLQKMNTLCQITDLHNNIPILRVNCIEKRFETSTWAIQKPCSPKPQPQINNHKPQRRTRLGRGV